MSIDFQTVQTLALERAAQIGELLDIADRLGKGEGEKAKLGQLQALKLAIDTRMRLLDLWIPKEQINTLKGNVRIDFDRHFDAPSSPPEAGSHSPQ